MTQLDVSRDVAAMMLAVLRDDVSSVAELFKPYDCDLDALGCLSGQLLYLCVHLVRVRADEEGVSPEQALKEKIDKLATLPDQERN